MVQVDLPSFLGEQGVTHPFNSNNIFTNTLDYNLASDMVKAVTPEEVKDAIFSMGNDKSPGPDGYTTAFFKEVWEIVANDVTKAVQEFFINGTLLKELNHTIIALILKVAAPSRINDYRPISCCNVLFKCISKIISNRIKDCLKFLISSNQCAFKVDIQKAYDTVDWGFLKAILHGFGFHHRMVTWIMERVTSTFFSLNINESLHGFSKGNEGFVRYCSKLDIINLYFADDLFLFAHGNADSARVIMECLDEFKYASGLVPSPPKSTAYFCNVLNHTKLAILDIIPFEEGRLPVKYLGVPLISSRLVYRDCKELIEKVQNRIQDWKNKSLSAAGRLQLICSVISSMHVYWASVFIFSSRILLDIEQLMRGFLWCQGDMRRGKAKESLWVKWIDVYKLRGRSFWDIHFRGNMTWGWRKMLQLRPIIWQHVWYKIGDGSTVYTWFDRWDSLCPIYKIVSPRDIHSWNHMKIYAGLSKMSSSLYATIDYMIPMSKRRSARSIISRLVLAASSYFI
ncbi:hypothetical protein Tco_0281299 [Tanacetum coccineum]